MVRVLKEAELECKTARKAGIEQLARLNDDVPHHFLLRSDIVPETRVLELVAPEPLRVYSGPFVKPYQLVFSTCDLSSVILSVIAPEDVRDGHVPLLRAGWLSPAETYEVYARMLRSQPLLLVKTRVLRARHPYDTNL